MENPGLEVFLPTLSLLPVSRFENFSAAIHGTCRGGASPVLQEGNCDRAVKGA